MHAEQVTPFTPPTAVPDQPASYSGAVNAFILAGHALVDGGPCHMPAPAGVRLGPKRVADPAGIRPVGPPGVRRSIDQSRCPDCPCLDRQSSAQNARGGAEPLEDRARGLIPGRLPDRDRAGITLQLDKPLRPARATQPCTCAVTEPPSVGVRSRRAAGAGLRSAAAYWIDGAVPARPGTASTRHFLLERPWRGRTGTPYC